MAAALGVRRSKVFGEGRCVPLDRNAYCLVDANLNAVVLGSRFDASLADIAAYLGGAD